MKLSDCRTLLTVCAMYGMLALTGCGGGGEETGDVSTDPNGGGGSDAFAIVSGGQTGVYYTAAGAISSLAQQTDPSLVIDVRTSGGSVANARLIGSGEADLAIMQNDIAAYARSGKLMFEGEPIDNLMGVASLYPEHIQIVTRADSGIKTVADLKGKKVAIGATGSGTEQNALQILAAYGLSVDDLGGVERLKASTSGDYLKDKRVDAAFFTFGVGAAAIDELAYSMKGNVVFVPVDGKGRETLMKAYNFYREAVIKAGSYEGVDADVPTVSVMATLVARDDVPAAVIETILRGMFENIDVLRGKHAQLQAVNKADAQANLSLPLHAGAAAYYAGGMTEMEQPSEFDAGAASTDGGM